MRHLASLISLLLLLSFTAVAQTYRYVGVEDGLSNRRIYRIQQDSIGYMWFLTNDGMDRYDGKEVRHYNFVEERGEYAYPLHLGWLQLDKKGYLWVVDKKGRIFYYDSLKDLFVMAYKLPDVSLKISSSYLDSDENIWLCSRHSITLYNIRTQKVLPLDNVIGEEVISIQEVGKNEFLLSGESKIRHCRILKDELTILPQPVLENIDNQISTTYYHRPSHTLFIGTYGKGILTYDLQKQEIGEIAKKLEFVNIVCIKKLKEDELLIATEGMGIHSLKLPDYTLQLYTKDDDGNENEIARSNINDLYIDKVKRVWASYYPDGVVAIDKRYRNYRRIKQFNGSKQALTNRQVHAVIEDSEGDLWFGTGNGISLYHSKSRQWQSFLTQNQTLSKDKNQIFLTLCEVSPGIIWAGGYTSGIYVINKHHGSVEYVPHSRFINTSARPDKYIRHIFKDSDGGIWIGGYYNLSYLDPTNMSMRHYSGINNIITIAELDKYHLWVGTASGLYLLDKESGISRTIDLHEEAAQINTLYQAKDNLLYIGTNGSGLILYNLKDKSIKHYHKDNCAMVSNTINAILSASDSTLVMSTENGISRYTLKDKKFQNWTKEAGLNPYSFNISSAAICRNGNYIFGSNDGAVEFLKGSKMPTYHYTPMLLSNFHISYQAIYPKEEGSPLTKDINETTELRLKYSQSSFSFKISNINYDAHDNVLLYWRFERNGENWNRLPVDGVLRFTNLAPGDYRLQLRAIPKEEPYRQYEERCINIHVAQPIWLSPWFLIGYLIIIVIIFVASFRFMVLRKQQKIANEKTNFFINTAHDIRTPLTLIKAPLEEILHSNKLEGEESNMLNMALRNVATLIHMTTNLLNFERTEIHTSKLHIGLYKLNEYLEEILQTFYPYATSRHIRLVYNNDIKQLHVWLDKEKMDSILKNVITNALKYTMEQGEVAIQVSATKENWQVEVKDTGIGIPEKEQKRLFKQHFRASNAINLKVSGSGMGLMLVQRLVKIHEGKIVIESREGVGTSICMTFPQSKSKFKAYTEEKDTSENNSYVPVPSGNAPLSFPSMNKKKIEKIATDDKDKQRLLIVEDNDELRNYLIETLGSRYSVMACENGEEAMQIVKESAPDIIVSDIMMPKMRGDEFCYAIKSDIETSHIPVLLLTALGGENDILKGLNIGADDYIVKPFNINILEASINNLLKNRALLRKKFTNMDPVNKEEQEIPPGTNELDVKFMDTVRKNIEEHLTDPDFNIDVLCASLNMSRTSFYNKIKALTGRAPADHIREIRLKKAAQMLLESNLSINEIAEATGFNDGKYFREVFKKYYHQNPSFYKTHYYDQ